MQFFQPANCSFARIMILLFLSVGSVGAGADVKENHNGVDKIYDPYVQPLERELELRGVYQTDDDPVEDDVLRHRIGFGVSITARIFAEIQAKSIKLPGGTNQLDGYELETKIQLTEQGEYGADWGLLLELGRQRSESIAEFSMTLLLAKHWGSWVGTLNTGVEYEFGSDIVNEFDTRMAAQLRYRFREYLEPAIEFYADEFTRGIGPVLTGLIRTEGKAKWRWETGVIFLLNNTTPERSLRFLLEYEF